MLVPLIEMFTDNSSSWKYFVLLFFALFNLKCVDKRWKLIWFFFTIEEEQNDLSVCCVMYYKQFVFCQTLWWNLFKFLSIFSFFTAVLYKFIWIHDVPILKHTDEGRKPSSTVSSVPKTSTSQTPCINKVGAPQHQVISSMLYTANRYYI